MCEVLKWSKYSCIFESVYFANHSHFNPWSDSNLKYQMVNINVIAKCTKWQYTHVYSLYILVKPKHHCTWKKVCKQLNRNSQTSKLRKIKHYIGLVFYRARHGCEWGIVWDYVIYESKVRNSGPLHMLSIHMNERYNNTMYSPPPTPPPPI